MRRKKEDIAIIVFAGILIIIIYSIIVVLVKAPPQPSGSSTASVTPKITNPTPTPQINYDAASQQRLLDRVTNRKPLQASDVQTKTQILTLLPTGEKSGTLYKSTNITIDYVSSADLFQVEIDTINVQEAKNEANVWFRNRGMSQDAICNAPVMFYLNNSVIQQLQNINFTFSPLSNGC